MFYGVDVVVVHELGVQVAGNHGRAVGKTISEGKGQPFVKTPYFWSARS